MFLCFRTEELLSKFLKWKDISSLSPINRYERHGARIGWIMILVNCRTKFWRVWEISWAILRRKRSCGTTRSASHLHQSRPLQSKWHWHLNVKNSCTGARVERKTSESLGTGKEPPRQETQGAQAPTPERRPTRFGFFCLGGCIFCREKTFPGLHPSFCSSFICMFLWIWLWYSIIAKIAVGIWFSLSDFHCRCSLPTSLLALKTFLAM